MRVKLLRLDEHMLALHVLEVTQDLHLLRKRLPGTGRGGLRLTGRVPHPGRFRGSVVAVPAQLQLLLQGLLLLKEQRQLIVQLHQVDVGAFVGAAQLEALEELPETEAVILGDHGVHHPSGGGQDGGVLGGAVVVPDGPRAPGVRALLAVGEAEVVGVLQLHIHRGVARAPRWGIHSEGVILWGSVGKRCRGSAGGGAGMRLRGQDIKEGPGVSGVSSQSPPPPHQPPAGPTYTICMEGTSACNAYRLQSGQIVRLELG